MSENAASGRLDNLSVNAPRNSTPSPAKPLYYRLPIKVLSPIHQCLPFWLSYLLAYLISRYNPTSNPPTCPARSLDPAHGFIGNPDLYGLGVRLSLYLTWLTATIALLFAPSLRLTIASSYALVHIGTLIALLVLLLRQSCLYVAEVNVLIQLHWAGAALVLAPSPYTDGSKSHDRLFGALALGGLPLTMWLNARVFFSSHPELLGTPGGTGLVFWSDENMGTKQRWTMGLVSITPMCQALFALMQRDSSEYKTARRSLTTFAGQLARDIVSWRLASILDGLFLSGFVFSALTWLVVSPDRRIRSESEGFPHKRNIAISYHSFRAGTIALLAIFSVETVLWVNDVSEVHEVGSSGQILPLVLGLAQLVWLGVSMKRVSLVSPKSHGFERLEKGSGLQDSSGKWL